MSNPSATSRMRYKVNCCLFESIFFFKTSRLTVLLHTKCTVVSIHSTYRRLQRHDVQMEIPAGGGDQIGTCTTSTS